MLRFPGKGAKPLGSSVQAETRARDGAGDSSGTSGFFAPGPGPGGRAPRNLRTFLQLFQPSSPEPDPAPWLPAHPAPSPPPPRAVRASQSPHGNSRGAGREAGTGGSARTHSRTALLRRRREAG